jgi:hypothetical protein
LKTAPGSGFQQEGLIAALAASLLVRDWIMAIRLPDRNGAIATVRGFV